MVDGIVLAGGFSKRAKTNKMLLKFKNKALILHTIETMHQVCQRIIVVTGHYHDELSNLLSRYDFIDLVYNDRYALGMFTSIQAGVNRSSHDFFIIPGDCPLVHVETYMKMIETNADILVPSYNHHLGHPIFFKQEFKDKILKTNHDNLKSFRNDYDFTIIEVSDSGVVLDIDNLDDYRDLIRKD